MALLACSVYERETALLGRAAYGLPELFGDDLPGRDLVACAGCYATASQLAAAPALGLGERIGTDVTVSAMSASSCSRWVM